jgi:hypothetical protein
VLHTIVAALFTWLGAYLIKRAPRDVPVLFTGLGALAYAAGIVADSFDHPASAVFAALPALCWGVAAIRLWSSRAESPAPRPIQAIWIVFTVFIGLGGGLLILPLNILPKGLILFSAGTDVLVLGIAIAAFDAFNQGEGLRRDMLASAGAAGAMGVIFGGQAALFGAPLNAVIPITLTAVALPTFAEPLQTLLDRLTLAQSPQMQHARAELRATAEALPRALSHDNLSALDEETFIRITRRAVSAMTDLSKLAASPLMQHPRVTARLSSASDGAQVLARAAALKAVLTDSIGKLKPDGEAAFGTSDVWRHYNALHFPYAVGLKPYRPDSSLTNPIHQAALAWFQTQVPERTLHHWQTAAAKLIAQDLRADLWRTETKMA